MVVLQEPTPAPQNWNGLPRFLFLFGGMLGMNKCMPFLLMYRIDEMNKENAKIICNKLRYHVHEEHVNAA